MSTRNRRISSEQVAGLLAGLLLTGAATAALYFLRGRAETETIALLYLLPVGFSTALWGLAPGVGSAILATPPIFLISAGTA